MSDHDDRLIPHQFFHCFLQLIFIFRIHICGCLVEDDDGRVFQDGAGDGDPLLFAAGEGSPAFADHRVVSVGKRFDKLMAAGLSGRFNNLFMGCVGTAEFDIVFNRIRKEIDFLEHHADLIHQGFQSIFPDICIPDAYGTMIHVPEACDQIAESGFSGSAGAYDRSRCLIGNGHGDILQDRLAVVGKIYVFYRNIVLLGMYYLPLVIHFPDPVDLICVVDGTADNAQTCGCASCRLDL